MDMDTRAVVQRDAAVSQQGGMFPATRWSIVLRARQHGEPHAAEALAQLCKTYWKPVYAFLRRQGNTPHDAEDLTQGFFAMLLERDSLASVEEAKGRLRSFLLMAVKRFAANEHERANALKRGGRIVHVALDAEEAEQDCVMEPSTDVTPDVLFERQWALALLDTVLKKLRAEYAKDGRERVFDALKDRLSADGEAAKLAQTAAELGMNEGAVKVAVYRMRQRYRRVLHDEIALTVDSPDEVEGEIGHLFEIFGRHGA